MSDLIAPHLAALRAEGLSENTVHDRQGLLSRLARDLPHGIDTASTEELQQWLGRPGWSTKTRETYWTHIVGFYRWAVRGRSQKIDWDPSEDLTRPRPKKPLPRVAADDQLRQCLGQLGPRARRAVILAAGVGMRASEIADSDRDHFTRRRVAILGKGDKSRSVPVPEDVWDEIGDEPTGRLILNHGEPVTGAWVTQHCALALDRIGLPKLTIHWFRGAYATRLRRSGVDTIVISRLLGHSSVATTQRYIDLDDEDLDDAVGRLPALDQPTRLKVGTRAGA